MSENYLVEDFGSLGSFLRLLLAHALDCRNTPAKANDIKCDAGLPKHIGCTRPGKGIILLFRKASIRHQDRGVGHNLFEHFRRLVIPRGQLLTSVAFHKNQFPRDCVL